MLRLAIVDQDGKIFPTSEVPSAAELLALTEQAKALIRECERVVKLKFSTGPARQVPYSS